MDVAREYSLPDASYEADELIQLIDVDVVISLDWKRRAISLNERIVR